MFRTGVGGSREIVVDHFSTGSEVTPKKKTKTKKNNNSTRRKNKRKKGGGKTKGRFRLDVEGVGVRRDTFSTERATERASDTLCADITLQGQRLRS